MYSWTKTGQFMSLIGHTADVIVEYMQGRQLLRIPRHSLDQYGRRGFSVPTV